VAVNSKNHILVLSQTYSDIGHNKRGHTVVNIFDEKGSPLLRFSVGYTGKTMAVDSDDNIAIGGRGIGINIFSADGHLLKKIPQLTYSVKYLPDGRLLSSSKSKFMVINTTSGEIEYHPLDGLIIYLEVDATNNVVLATNWDRMRVEVYSLTDYRLNTTFASYGDGKPIVKVWGISVNPKNGWVYLSDFDGNRIDVFK
jgi:DNA-binding beta-propeller fold protein YncE